MAQIVSTYPEENIDKMTLGKLVNGVPTSKGTIVTHVHGRIFRRTNHVPPSTKHILIDQKIDNMVNIQILKKHTRHKFIYCEVQGDKSLKYWWWTKTEWLRTNVTNPTLPDIKIQRRYG